MRFASQSNAECAGIISGELIWHDDVEDEIENGGMEVWDKYQTKYARKNAEKFNFVVTGNAAGEIVGDFLMKF